MASNNKEREDQMSESNLEKTNCDYVWDST